MLKSHRRTGTEQVSVENCEHRSRIIADCHGPWLPLLSFYMRIEYRRICRAISVDGAYLFKGMFARFTEYVGKADLNKCY